MNSNELKARVSIDSLVESYGIELQSAGGGELKGLCPFHSEKTPSFTVTPSTGLFCCFGCGAGGDIFEFVQQIERCDFKDAANKLIERVDGNFRHNLRRSEPRKAKEVSPPIEIIPEPHSPYPADFSKQIDGQWVKHPIIARWPYRLADGKLIGYACRYEFVKPDGSTGKELVICRTIDGKWRFKGFPEPRPIYGLDRIGNSKIVIIAEGEKTADAAHRLLPSPAVTWPGGGKAINKVDWSPLAGRHIVILPDNDPAGFATAEGYYDARSKFREGLAQLLAPIASKISIVDPPHGAPESWDIADADWTTEQAIAWVKSSMRPPRDPEPPHTEADIPPSSDDRDAPPPGIDHYQADGSEPPDKPKNDPFVRLGFRKNAQGNNDYFYYCRATKQVLSFTAATHSPANLNQLAPMAWWKSRFPDGKGKIEWDSARDSLIGSGGVGLKPFTESLIRGRGAWFDNGQVVVHAGDHIIMAGKRYELGEAPSRYIYEQDSPITINLDNCLNVREANALIDICSRPVWERPVNGRLLAGWIVCAIVCGALKWRPHVWVTGSAGSGKSTVMEEIIKRALGDACLFVQGVSSEAGIRQTLKHDAIPVIFDEAESDKKQSAFRMDSIMDLVTQSSSDNSAAIVKGSQGGRALSFKIRSCFCFSSIGVNLRQHAARTRVTVLGLRPDRSINREQNFFRFLNDIDTIMTEEWVARLHARVITMIPIIRQNVAAFTSAANTVLNDRRAGDQIGTLLAGCYALHSNNPISHEDALKWVAEQDWAEQAEVTEENDELSCIGYLLEQTLRFSHGVERSIGEIIKIARGHYDGEVKEMEAEDTLSRNGIKLIDDKIAISNTSSAIAKILSDTPWERGWGRTFKRLPNSQSSDAPIYFKSGRADRATIIPLTVIFGD